MSIHLMWCVWYFSKIYVWIYILFPKYSKRKILFHFKYFIHLILDSLLGSFSVRVCLINLDLQHIINLFWILSVLLNTLWKSRTWYGIIGVFILLLMDLNATKGIWIFSMFINMPKPIPGLTIHIERMIAIT